MSKKSRCLALAAAANRRRQLSSSSCSSSSSSDDEGGKDRKVKRLENKENVLQVGIQDLHQSESLSDCLFIAEDNVRIKCHQCVLVCSPILKSIFLTSDVRYGGGTSVISIPEFHGDSIKTLLLFLYSGEVALKKGSRTLIEFKELCNILKINPPVNKYRTSSSTSSSSTTTTTDIQPDIVRKQSCEDVIFNCKKCDMTFNDEELLNEHNNTEHNKMEEVKDDASTKSEDEENNEEKREKEEINRPALHPGLQSFRMPDNFDLPDELMNESSKSNYADLIEPQLEMPPEPPSPPMFVDVNVQENEVDSTSGQEKLESTYDSDSFEDILKAAKQKPQVVSQPSNEIKKDKSKLIDDLFGGEPEKEKKNKHLIKKSSNKSEIKKSSNGNGSSSSKSVVDELAEKRMRTIGRLKSDKIPVTNPKEENSEKRKIYKKYHRSHSSKHSKSSSSGKKVRSDNYNSMAPNSEDEKFLVPDDEESEDSESDISLVWDSGESNVEDELELPDYLKSSTKKRKVKHKKRKRRMSQLDEVETESEEEMRSSRQGRLLERREREGLAWMVKGNGRKVRVSVVHNGQVSFIDYATYKLRLINGPSNSDSSGNESTPSRLRRIKKKDLTSYEDTKWDKLKLKRLERMKNMQSSLKCNLNPSTSSSSSNNKTNNNNINNNTLSTNPSTSKKSSSSHSSSSSGLKRSVSSDIHSHHYSKKKQRHSSSSSGHHHHHRHSSSSSSSSYRPKSVFSPPPPSKLPGITFNYGLSGENKLFEGKLKSASGVLSKVSFKKKPPSENKNGNNSQKHGESKPSS